MQNHLDLCEKAAKELKKAATALLADITATCQEWDVGHLDGPLSRMKHDADECRLRAADVSMALRDAQKELHK
jgi:rhodanese-related sulfurtransferase